MISIMHKLPPSCHGSLNPSLCTLSFTWSSLYYCSISTLLDSFHCLKQVKVFHISESLHIYNFFSPFYTYSNSLGILHFILSDLNFSYSQRVLLCPLVLSTAPRPKACYSLWLHCDHSYNLSGLVILFILISDYLSILIDYALHVSLDYTCFVCVC